MVTGHRPQHLGYDRRGFVRTELERIAARLAHAHGMTVGISGMALGADTDWAWAVLKAQAQLWSYIPFPQQPDRWSPSQRSTWDYLRSRASFENVTAQSYSVAALHQRNDDMLGVADLVVAVWDPAMAAGGTASCVKKAVDLGLPIIHVDPVARRTMLRMP